MTDVGISKSRVQEKENISQIYSQNNKFPAISKVSSLAATRLKAKKNEITDVREYQVLVTKLDELKYENKKLVEKIEQLKQNSYKGNNKDEKKIKAISEIAEFKSQLVLKAKAYESQKALKNKL